MVHIEHRCQSQAILLGGGLSDAKRVSGYQTLFVSHVSTNIFVDALLNKSTWSRVYECVSGQKEAG